MAANRIFWDVNILVDFIDRRPLELDETDSIYELAVKRQLRLTVSEQVICTALYLSDIKRPELAIVEFLKNADILPNSNSLVRSALSSGFKDKEDAILYHLALHHRMNAFITRDKKDFAPYASPLLPVMTPREFMHSQ
jgi:predicted nucleic acid-binding protein